MKHVKFNNKILKILPKASMKERNMQKLKTSWK